VSLTPQFGSADNWISRWNLTKQANIIPSDPPSHDPIPPFECPTTFEGFTFAIWCGTQSPKITWKSGGLVTANVVTGISVAGSSFSQIAQQWLNLGGVTIFRVPKLSQSVRLKFFPPYWFKSFAVAIWEYDGPGQPDPEAKLDSIYGRLP
jgi:hypothetical protein